MRLRDKDSLIAERQSFNEKLKQTVARIEKTIGVSRGEFLEMLGMTPKRFEQIEAGKSDFAVEELLSLSKALNLNIDLLFSGNIDYSALAQHFKGNHLALPEKYLSEHQQLSRVRGLHVICRYLQAFRGKTFAENIFSRFQIQSDFLNNLNEYVSPLLGADILKELTNEAFSEKEIRVMGTMTLSVNKANLGRVLGKKQTPKQLYGSLYEDILPHYDEVFDYKLTRLTDQGCTIVATPSEKAKEAFKTTVVGNRELCLYKQGVIISFLANIENRFATLLESGCIYEGADCCTYHVSWN